MLSLLAAPLHMVPARLSAAGLCVPSHRPTQPTWQLLCQLTGSGKPPLTTCAPDLDDKAAEDIAAVVLNNMKT